MAYKISSLFTDLNRKVSPGNVNQSRDKFGMVSETARNLLERIKPKELSKRILLENALYDQVDRYHCPNDLDQKNIMQVYRLKDQRNVDTFYHNVQQVTNRRFDQHRIGDRNMVTIEWDKGKKFIKLSGLSNFSGGLVENNQGLTIHQMNSITENGTWNVFGNVTNLATDNLTFITGTGSIRFDINNSSNIGGIENFTLTPFDLRDYFNIGKIFTWIDLPNINQLQTVQFEMYSSPGNGYSITVNSPHDTDEFQVDQNLMGFTLDSSTMATIGTPDPSNLNHIKFTFTTNGTLSMNGIRMDNIVARKGTCYGIQYISKYMFMDVNGIWKEEPTDVSDDIMLNYDATQCFVQEASCVLAQEIYTDPNSKRLQKLEADLELDYAWYKKRYKEEFIPEQQEMYKFGVDFGYNNRGQWNGGRWDHSNDNI